MGKSTPAVHLAAWLHAQGHTVTLADCDMQQSSSEWIREAVPAVKAVHLDDPGTILNELPALANEADFVVADGPGSQSETSRALLLRADLAIVPCKASMLVVRALAKATEALRQAQDIRSGKPSAMIVLSMVGKNYRLTQDMKDAAKARIADTVLDSSEAFANFSTAWTAPERRLWLSALIEDWPAAHEVAAGLPGLTALTAPRAEQCREMRRQRLQHELGVQYRAADALHALADLGATDLDNRVEDALHVQPSGLTSAALEIIERQDDPRWCEPVYALLSRLDPAAELPRPHLWVTSLGFLLRHGHRTEELLAALPKAGGPEVGEAVLLALEHAPGLALPLIRRGLIDDIPANRSKIAAILALIAEPWSRRELMAALEVSDDQQKTADARAALLESGDEDAQKAVLGWEERNPHEDEVGSYLEIGGRRLGPFYTFGEVSLKNRASWIRYEMDALHDRVMKLRDVRPPEPPAARPWWRIWTK